MQKSDVADICTQIREAAITRKGWTGAKLASESGLSYRTIQEIMRGTARLRPQNVQRIAKALGMTPAELGAGDIPPIEASVLAEESPQYGQAPASDLPPLHQLVTWLSLQLGVTEEVVMQFVLDQMKRKRATG